MNEPIVINMRDATVAQLMKFATEALGLSVHPQTGREKIIARIETAGWQPDTAASERTITIMAGDATAPAGKEDAADTQAQPELSVKERDARIVTINIARTDEAGGDEMVPVGVNGSVMAIPRGQDAPIRWPYFVALLHAVKHLHEPTGKNNEMDPNPRKVPFYPFTIINGPAEAHEMMRKALAA